MLQNYTVFIIENTRKYKLLKNKETILFIDL